ncbi:MAG: hypothetical protein KDD25_10425 [Bdellovibrionales bacterium]|nr:hypothetical protein [Bdellovibrionales bacterium]
MKTLMITLLLGLGTFANVQAHANNGNCVGGGAIGEPKVLVYWDLGYNNQARSVRDCQNQAYETIVQACYLYAQRSLDRTVTGLFKYVGDRKPKYFKVSGTCSKIRINSVNAISPSPGTTFNL